MLRSLSRFGCLQNNRPLGVQLKVKGIEAEGNCSSLFAAKVIITDAEPVILFILR
jgi:hypothetical protein